MVGNISLCLDNPCGNNLSFRNFETSLGWALISGFYGLAFGALCEIPWLVTVGFRVAFTAWVAGIPFDLVHGISNFLIALVLQPLYKLLMNLKICVHQMSSLKA